MLDVREMSYVCLRMTDEQGGVEWGHWMVGLRGMAIALLLTLTACASVNEGETVEEGLEFPNGFGSSATEAVDGGEAPRTSGGAELVAPNVWRTVTNHAEGGQSVGHHWTGVTGAEWMAKNVWTPRIERAIEELLITEDSGAREGLEAWIRVNERNLEVLDRWRRIEDSRSLLGAPLSCTPYVLATAIPISGGGGAQASAGAKTCASGHLATGQANAWSQQNGEDAEAFSRPTGVAGSAWASQSGTPTWSYARADAYPLSSAEDCYPSSNC